MNKVQERHAAEESELLVLMNTCGGKPVKSPKYWGGALGWGYRKTLRVLYRLMRRDKVGVVGNRFNSWWYSIERTWPIITDIPF